MSATIEQPDYHRVSPGRIALIVDYVPEVAGQPVIIPRHFESDGATIPKIAQPIVGKPLDESYLPAAVVHDWYCKRALEFRCWATRVHGDTAFLWMLRALEVPYWKRLLMFLAVVLWGRFRFRYLDPVFRLFSKGN